MAINCMRRNRVQLCHSEYTRNHAINYTYRIHAVYKMAAQDIRIRLRSCDLYSVKGITLGRPLPVMYIFGWQWLF